MHLNHFSVSHVYDIMPRLLEMEFGMTEPRVLCLMAYFV